MSNAKTNMACLESRYVHSFVFCVLAAETELQLSANQKSARLDLDKKGAKNHDLQL